VDAVSIAAGIFLGSVPFLIGLLIGRRGWSWRPPALSAPTPTEDKPALETKAAVSLVRLEWVTPNTKDEYGHADPVPVCTVIRAGADPEMWQRTQRSGWCRRSDAQPAPFWLWEELKGFVERDQALREIATTEVVSEAELPARRTPYRD